MNSFQKRFYFSVHDGLQTSLDGFETSLGWVQDVFGTRFSRVPQTPEREKESTAATAAAVAKFMKKHQKTF